MHACFFSSLFGLSISMACRRKNSFLSFSIWTRQQEFSASLLRPRVNLLPSRRHQVADLSLRHRPKHAPFVSRRPRTAWNRSLVIVIDTAQPVFRTDAVSRKPSSFFLLLSSGAVVCDTRRRISSKLIDRLWGFHVLRDFHSAFDRAWSK